MPNNHLRLNKIRPSRLLILLLAIMHGLAVLSVLLLPSFVVSIELFIKPFLFMLIILSYFYYYKKMLNIVAVAMKSDNRWDLLKFDGVYCTDKQLLRSYISDWMVILVFSSETERGRMYVYLTGDAVDRVILSELKCRLNIACQTPLKKSG